MSTSGVWSGNVGEWGEAFALLHLLAHNELHNADVHGKRIEEEFSVIEAILRTETSGRNIKLSVEDDMICVNIDGVEIRYVPKTEFAQVAHSLFQKISAQARRTAHYDEQDFLESIGCESLKASSLMKADLSALIYDGIISSRTRRDYSIKTVLRGRPSLANASCQSYIDYELDDMDQDRARRINAVNTRTLVVDRVKLLVEICGSVPRPKVRTPTFERNMRQCYFRAPEVVGLGLLYGDTIRGKNVIDSIAYLRENNPLGLAPHEIVDYETAIRKYLLGIFFDLRPGSYWDGPCPVDGYLLVTDDEDVLAYQVSRTRSFEDYLLLHSQWDTPAMDRYPDIAKVWQRADGKWMFTLNCVVRYEKREYSGKNASQAGIVF